MGIEITSNTLNSVTQKLPQSNVAATTKTAGTETFKKLDADGDGKISQDEFTRFTTALASSQTDLSKFAGNASLEDFDVALGQWLDSLSDTTATVATSSTSAVAEKTSTLPPLDSGKTWAKAGAAKIARGEELNFGHKTVDGELWKMEGGSPVWADTGTQVTRAQLAAMPDYQVKKFYQMMGLGYDPKVDFPDPAERKRLAATVTIPDPGSAMEEAGKKLDALNQDLDNLHAKLTERENHLKKQMETATPSVAAQIHAQLAQLGRSRQQIETMQEALKDLSVPAAASTEAETRILDALDAMSQAVRELAGADSASMAGIVTRFAHHAAQLRDPERDLSKDALAQSQYNSLMDTAKVLGGLQERMDQLVRQLADVDVATAAQINAQLALLQNTYEGFAQIGAPLLNYRPDPAMSEDDRREKAAIVEKLHTLLKQMAGMDRASFDKAIAEAKQLLGSL